MREATSLGNIYTMKPTATILAIALIILGTTACGTTEASPTSDDIEVCKTYLGEDGTRTESVPTLVPALARKADSPDLKKPLEELTTVLQDSNGEVGPPMDDIFATCYEYLDK